MTRFKKILARTSAVAITMLAVATFSATASASTYAIRGDVNNDGKINVNDVAALQRYLKGNKEASITTASADVDRNGSINSADLIAVQQITIGDDKASFFVKGGNREFGENKIFLDNGKYFGIMQGDGNVVIYRRDSGRNTAVFNTGTHVNASSFKNHRLVFQADGNIVLYATQRSDGKTVARWHSRTYLGMDDVYIAYLDQNGFLQWTTKDRMVWSTDPNFINNERQRAKRRVESGYTYSTYRNAAIDFIFSYGTQSVNENREYDATIERENGGYRLHWENLCGPVRAPGSLYGTGATLYFGGDTVAWVHTHGKEVGWENDRFSDEDINIALQRNSVAFLGAPNGQIRVFEPGKDPVNARFQSGRVISENAPH